MARKDETRCVVIAFVFPFYRDARKRDDLMDKAKSWYEKASNQGHVPSKVGFAKMCLEDPTSDNVTTAMKIYEEADKADNVDATYNLGFVNSFFRIHSRFIMKAYIMFLRTVCVVSIT